VLEEKTTEIKRIQLNISMKSLITATILIVTRIYKLSSQGCKNKYM
jgi:hypothetical protein